MGRLMIRQIVYNGDKFYYRSPILSQGINIIEASNGAGKTTLSSLIAYGLGNYVKQFDFKNKDENHIELFLDTNNYVMLEILIDEQIYELTRYFNKNNNNVIFVKGVNNNLEGNFVINRKSLTNKDDRTFSDWLLDKLNIEICEIYQGTSKFKINFSDLFRLIHYDQETNAKKIYKEHRISNNFISDSIVVRKVIFELLIGYTFSNYYSKIGDFNRVEKEKNVNKATLDSYAVIVENMGFDIVGEKENLKERLTELSRQLDKLYLYKENLKPVSQNTDEYNFFLQELRESYLVTDEKLHYLKISKNSALKELVDLKKLKENIIREATQIRKIILAHEELKIFSPDTCPCCFKTVKRSENHCICGNEINEDQYQRFFYDSNEYLDILKSKQKSVETVDMAINDCLKELASLKDEISLLERDKESIRKQLIEIEKNIVVLSNDSEIKAIDSEILIIKEKITRIEGKQLVYEQYNKLESKLISSKLELENIGKELARLEKNLKEMMNDRREEFKGLYFEYLSKADSEVSTVEIDEDYMPTINGGIYRQASSSVPRRFMYYLTLLKMSITNKDVPFPKFLLIDTPENLGIDPENLNRCIEVLEILDPEKRNEYQVILTTGIGKYPKHFKKYLKETLNSSNKLLKIKEV